MPSDASRADEIDIVADLIRQAAGTQARQISEDLLTAHGSLANILHPLHLHADTSQAMLPDAVRTRLRALAALLAGVGAPDVLTGPVLANSHMLKRYLYADMAMLRRETFRVLFLDSGNRLLRDQIMWEGTVNKVQVHPREIIRVAIETGATALILAHNHPSGQSSPSAEDLWITQQIVEACTPLDICVHDHLIVARSDILSLAARYPKLFAPHPRPVPRQDGAAR